MNNQQISNLEYCLSGLITITSGLSNTLSGNYYTKIETENYVDSKIGQINDQLQEILA